MQRVTLQIEKMSCGNCLETVKSALEGLDGVDRAYVHLEDKTARVDYDASRVNTKQMAEAVEEKGYMIVP
ncbi:cation transporter [Alkalihalophilus pseudofirmus]|uniref:Copper chaperone CopZ n=1 Tax=Alkalihalophilus pseudofirmus TaxID=79885 RepID=A0AAJ2NPX1_ALKPS|nr:cation transporter [Alkalihalophilus pseudofirmus]MDV2886401.1 cation transporter [Alkalihalophilus pseudofirmus]WEG16640.1 cation transporter [Alkalihalophilus pseudofirmus]